MPESYEYPKSPEMAQAWLDEVKAVGIFFMHHNPTRRNKLTQWIETFDPNEFDSVVRIKRLENDWDWEIWHQEKWISATEMFTKALHQPR